jgi:DNA-binding ferritin-like protein
MATQPHEIRAWLGDNHGLTEDQIADLTRAADEIAERYPDPDDADDREAALTVAYRLMSGDQAVVDELARELAAARLAQVRALAGLRQAATTLIPDGDQTESGFARRAGIDRMAVRGWLGKR